MTAEMKAFHAKFAAALGIELDSADYRVDDYDWQQVFAIPDEWFSTTHQCPISLADVADVTHAWLWHGDYAETKLTALMRLVDDRWASVVAWCDTSGWDCVADVVWRVGSRDEVIAQGLDLEARRHLGLTLPGEGPGVIA